MIDLDPKTGQTIVALLRQIADTLDAIAAEVTLLSRAVDRAVQRGTDPPQAREFLVRRPRRTEP